MLSIEKGIVIREITVKKPSRETVEMIIKAQASRLNRLVKADWQDEKGEITVSVTVVPNRLRAVEQMQQFSYALGGVTRLTVQEILPVNI